MAGENKTAKIELRVTESQKDFIKRKSEEMGYGSVTAFLISCAENQIRIDVDMSPYQEIVREINYIGKNINSLVRRINSEGFYSDTDIQYLTTNQEKLINKMNKEYKALLNFRKNFNIDTMSLKDKEKLVKQLKENDIPITKKMMLEKIFDDIRNDILYVVEIIQKSPSKHEGLDRYLLNYLSGETLFAISEKEQTNLSDEIFEYVQKLKFKMANLDNQFDDDDWFALKDILDEYEIY